MTQKPLSGSPLLSRLYSGRLLKKLHSDHTLLCFYEYSSDESTTPNSDAQRQRLLNAIRRCYDEIPPDKEP